MPEEAPAAPAAEAESAPSPAPAQAEAQEAPNGNDWLRDSVEGSLYSRTLDTSSLRQQREDARAELRRGRRPTSVQRLLGRKAPGRLTAGCKRRWIAARPSAANGRRRSRSATSGSGTLRRTPSSRSSRNPSRWRPGACPTP